MEAFPDRTIEAIRFFAASGSEKQQLRNHCSLHPTRLSLAEVSASHVPSARPASPCPLLGSSHAMSLCPSYFVPAEGDWEDLLEQGTRPSKSVEVCRACGGLLSR